MNSLWQSISSSSASHPWDSWKLVGWTGNVVFFTRFLVQWYYTEKRRQVVVPGAFWWLSLAGAFLLFVYGLHLGDYVFIFSYAFVWIPYLRNLVIHHRHQATLQICSGCETTCLPKAVFCHQCGLKLAPAGPAATTACGSC
jgi:lipid-A-disaccharide synthase-like uncharacterized protein